MLRQRTRVKKTGAGAALLPAVFILFLPLSGLSSAAAQDSPPVPKFGPMEKSLLLPGWGQIAEGRILKGAVFAAAELGCLIGAALENRLGNENYDLYKTATDADSASRFRRLVERHDGRRNAFLLAGAAVWAVNLFDVFGLVTNKKSESGSFSLAIGIPHVAPREVRLSIDCRF